MTRTKDIILKKGETKNEEIFLQGLKPKQPIFTEIKNIFKPFFFMDCGLTFLSVYILKFRKSQNS